MRDSFDVVIIGGGPTGSSAATFLVRQGLSVLVLEKMSFPREHVGESMLPASYDLFEELGVLEQMKLSYTRKPGVTFSNADGSRSSHWCFNKVIDGPGSLSFHARRSEFDQLLLDNARKEGVEVLEETEVVDVRMNNDTCGAEIVARHPVMGECLFNAKFLIDASGQDCFLARKKNNQKPFTRLHVRLALSSHWENVQMTESLANGNITIIHFGGEKLGWIWLIPIGPDRLSIGLALNMSYANEQRKILIKEHGVRHWQQAFYLQEIKESSIVRGIIENASLAWDVVANGDFSYYAEEKYGKSYAILGDAGAFLDPIFSSGIYLGIKSAKLTASGIAHLIKTGDDSLMREAFKIMEGGYKVVEDLIVAFYSTDTIDFTHLAGSEGIQEVQMEAAYKRYHMLLAGNFFEDHERSLKAIHALKDPMMIEKYSNLIKYETKGGVQPVCKTSHHVFSI